MIIFLYILNKGVIKHMERLLKLLNEIRPDLDFTKESRLVTDSVIDSFDIITIVTEINEVFDISINAADLEPENLNSAEAMWELITRLEKE